MNRIHIAILTLAVALTIGCNRPAANPGVAVVDLDRIAQTLGWNEEINRLMQSADTELRGQIEQIARAGITAIDQAKRDLSTEAKLSADQITRLNQITDVRELSALPFSEAQRNKLIETLNQANANLQGAQAQYQPVLQRRRAEIIIEFRNRIRPTVQQVANDAGYAVVLVNGDHVFNLAPTADITEKVVTQLRGSAYRTP